MHLAEIIKRSSFRLVPNPPAPSSFQSGGSRAIVFYVYGTLVISESGDISLAEQSDREDLMRQAFAHCGIGPVREDTRLFDRFHEAVHAFQDRRREDGIAWPELKSGKSGRNFSTGTAKPKGSLTAPLPPLPGWRNSPSPTNAFPIGSGRCPA